MQKKQIGDHTEALARSWLEHRGFRFIERNFSRRVGELDLIMCDPDEHTIVFIEVRFRSDQQYGGGIASVNYAKQRKLVRTANAWLQRHGDSRTRARIDVIGICPATAHTPEPEYWQGHHMTWIVNAVEE